MRIGGGQVIYSEENLSNHNPQELGGKLQIADLIIHLSLRICKRPVKFGTVSEVPKLSPAANSETESQNLPVTRKTDATKLLSSFDATALNPGRADSLIRSS